MTARAIQFTFQKFRIMTDINLLKNNADRDWSDLEWVEEFYDFLQGKIPEGMHISRDHAPKLSPKKAMSIVWYLQEHMPVIPDTIERCDNCDDLFDSSESGLYWESKGKHFCDACRYLAPENYDRGKK